MNLGKSIRAALIIATLAIVAMIVLTMNGCKKPDRVQFPPPGPPVPDSAGTPEECQAACDRLKVMQCPGWDGSPGSDEQFGTDDDVSCVQACIDIVTADLTTTLHQRCVAQSANCEEADRCFQGE